MVLGNFCPGDSPVPSFIYTGAFSGELPQNVKQSQKGYVEIMDKSQWKDVIINALTDIEMNLPQFSMIVDTLAETLEQRDKAYQEFLDSGAQIGVVKTSDRGAKNIARNPILSVWMDLNAAALQLWRECCLTPAAFKKVSLSAMHAADRNSFDKLLEKLIEES